MASTATACSIETRDLENVETKIPSKTKDVEENFDTQSSGHHGSKDYCEIVSAELFEYCFGMFAKRKSHRIFLALFMIGKFSPA